MNMRAMGIGSVILAGLIASGCSEAPTTAEPADSAPAVDLAEQAATPPPIEHFEPTREAPSFDPNQARSQATRQLVGRWNGRVELNEIVARELGLSDPVIHTLQSMQASLEFRPGGEAVMQATSTTDRGPQEVSVHARWNVRHAEANQVIISWQEETGQAEAVQVNFEDENTFTRPPPGNQANRDIGQMRFTRVR